MNPRTRAPRQADPETTLQAPRLAMRGPGLPALTLGAIGVVYGDIGTSPLYTMKEIFSPGTGVPLDPAHIIGATSTIFWALMLVVTLKYVLLVLRADNRGEGGCLALTALAADAARNRPRLRTGLLLLGVFGATLFYGDSAITPAISVLGAMEGLELVTPILKPYVVPISVGILVALFLVQRHGTHLVGRMFGPIIVIWFLTLGLTGLIHVVDQPQILKALHPGYALDFLWDRGWQVLAAIGAIVLAITGVEALYADMGHFGRRAIQMAWCGLVLPALALNYLGQGALLMADPSAIDNPFYRMFPADWVPVALVLATLAAIIASQAVISGAFSLTRQAIQLGYLPRMTVRSTSSTEPGQIYMPAVNALLLAAVVLVTIGFGSSSALAAAYGIAVTLTMLITTVLTVFVARAAWRGPWIVIVVAALFFLSMDALLFAGCIIKLFDGGWMPLVMGLTIFALMGSWARGRVRLAAVDRRDGLALVPFVTQIDRLGVGRIARTAIYPVANPELVPHALLHNLKHYQVLHDQNIVLHVVFCGVPWVAEADRLALEDLGNGFWRARLHVGFMETPNVPQALELAVAHGLKVDPGHCSYFLSREHLAPTQGHGPKAWSDRLFGALQRNAGSVAGYFGLPVNTVVELGTQVRV